MARYEPRPIWYDRVPFGFWTRSKNRRAYMRWLERKLRIRAPEDWYDLTVATLRRFGGLGILGHYRNSIPALVIDYLPWYDWKPWLFTRVPRGFWNDARNRREYLEWLGEKLGFREIEDWYQLTRGDVAKNRGGSLMLEYRSVFDLLTANFPENRWLEWRFSKVPTAFWEDPGNHRRYLEWLGEKLGFTEPEDWYRLEIADLRVNHGATLIAILGGPARIVMACFPEYRWYPWRFKGVPRHFWKDPANLRWYFEWLGEKLGFKKHEDWYRIRGSDLYENHGSSLFSDYGSAAAAVMAAFPEYDWREWLFSQTPAHLWDDPANVRRYLEWLGEKLGFEKYEDWYHVNARDIKKNGGSALLLHNNDSPPAILAVGFPEYDWEGWWFNPPPNYFWDDPTNVRRYLEWLGRELGFKEMEDWYRLRVEDLQVNRGRGLLVRFDSSAISLVMGCFPDYPWEPWKFARIADRIWDDPANCRRYLEWLGDQLGYKKPEDWYQITTRSFSRHHGLTLLNRYRGSPIAVLKTFMPEYDWKDWLFKTVPRAFWFDRKNRRRYLEWLAEKLGIRGAEGWSRLCDQDFTRNRGGGLISAYQYSVRDVLVDTFPKSHPARRAVSARPSGKGRS